MLIIAIIFDHVPCYLRGETKKATGASILSLPFGASTVLDAFVGRAVHAGADEVFVIPAFDVNGSYKRRIAALAGDRAKVWPLHRQDKLIENYEGGDIFVAFDARYWEEDDTAMSAVVADCRTRRAAIHRVVPPHGNGILRSTNQSSERLLFNKDGGVKRIRRLYDKIAGSREHDEMAVCALIAPQQLLETGPLFPMDQTRLRMLKQSSAGGDYAISGRVFNLGDMWEALELNRQAVANDIGTVTVPTGYTRRDNQMLLAEDCRVASSARIIGPVVVKSRGVIGDGATIVGPCVIGHRACVGPGVMIAQSILLDDEVVRGGASLVHAIGMPNGNGRIHGRAQGSAPAGNGSGGNGSRTNGSGGTRRLKLPPKLRVVQEPGAPSVPTLQGSGKYLVVKRVIDFLGALMGIVLLLPFLLFVALLIKVTSRGPVLFKDRREGLGGRVFACLKFRTMKLGADKEQRALYAKNELDGPQFKLANDHRITRWGQQLRGWNVDELPQLFNVLVGHMSLVGPRPSPFRENQICLPWRSARLSVRPGITGMWQICRARREESDFDQWIYYDTKYVRHMSFWLDLKIMLYTVTSLGGRQPVPQEKLIPLKKGQKDTLVPLF